jgi:hypothetical protein
LEISLVKIAIFLYPRLTPYFQEASGGQQQPDSTADVCPLREPNMLGALKPFLGHLIEATISGLVVVLLGWIVRTAIRRLLMRRRHIGGPWYQTSLDPRGPRCPRHDRVRVYRFFSRIWGDCDRIEPSEERPKRWRFRGRISHSVIYCHFWTDDTISNPRSFGVFLLQRLDAATWVGLYTSTVSTPNGDTGVLQRPKTFPLRWERERWSPASETLMEQSFGERRQPATK